ncbi:MAG: LytR C-terminal domain-containing protein, partial [Gammaproteobacteria bacterium]|nr:LytR C-terminal domain-containing protein [Gammaproteobacteria bacterium]
TQPFSYAMDPVSGTREADVYMKHRFTGKVGARGLSVAASLSSTLVAGDPSTNVSDGQSHRGAELHISHWTDTSGFHMNIGMATNSIYSESTMPMFTTVDMLTASMGVEMGISDGMAFNLQALASQNTATDDENLHLAANYHYTPSKSMAFTFGAAWGIPSNRSNPATSVYFGMAYSPASQSQSRFARLNPDRDYHLQNQILMDKAEQIDQRVARIEASLQKLANSLATSKQVMPVPRESVIDRSSMMAPKLYVEIINETGITGLGDKIATSLRSKGYAVTAVRTAPVRKKKRSIIQYREGMAEEAITLGHSLKGDQIVIKGRTMGDADVQLFLGNDFVQ